MKLKLDELKVQSFVTSLELEAKQTVQGGSDGYGGCGTPSAWNCGQSAYTCGPGWPSTATQDRTQTGYPCPSTACVVGYNPPPPPNTSSGCYGVSSGVPAGCTSPSTGYYCAIQGC